MMSFTWDAFVSHNRMNKPWVRQFVRQWRDSGLSVFFDEDSIEPGEDTVSGIERGLTGSRHIVLFLSPSSIASRWVALETSISLYADPDAKDRRLIPVVLEPIDTNTLRPAVARLNRIDLTDPLSRDERYGQLCKFLNISAAHSLPAVPQNLLISISSVIKADASTLKSTLYAARALSDIGPAMKPFGTYQASDSTICMDNMPSASAHVLVFPEHPSRVKDEDLEHAISEYEEARRNNVEVLAYVPSGYRIISGLRLGDFLRHVLTQQSITERTHFEAQISRDLDRIAQSNLIGCEPPLAAQHEQVVEKLYEHDLVSANKLNQAILRTTGGESPRANYNQACICSWLGEDDGVGREELLFQAKRYFEKAVEYGIVCLISLRGNGTVRPRAIISENPALELLFQRHKDLPNIVDDRIYFGHRKMGGGCVEATVLVALSDGRTRPASEVLAGQKVVSWNCVTSTLVQSVVQKRVPHFASELICINGALRLTAVHPVLVGDKWVPADRVQLGDTIQQASGGLQRVVSIERQQGRFQVFDFSVGPTPTFVAAGLVVHNK